VLLASDWRVTGVVKIVRRIWEVGVAGSPVIGRRWGVALNITVAVWTAGFHWWRSGNKKRKQSVSEYMLCYSLYAWLKLAKMVVHVVIP